MSRAYFARLPLDKDAIFSIDLETTRSINRIHLHATDTNDTVPQSDQNDFGFPRRLLVEAANMPDGSDAVRLFGYRAETVYDVGPIVSKIIPTIAKACVWHWKPRRISS